MNTPRFWYKNNSILSNLLYPLSIIWNIGSQIRALRKPVKKISVPIICIGNVVAGGSGKTPITIALAKILLAYGLKVHIICKGYKRNNKKTFIVNSKNQDYKTVGDEAIILNKICTTWVTNNRLLCAKKAQNNGANIILLDDGLQDTSIYKDLSLLVVNNEQKLGNKKLIPSGPLRETYNSACKKSDAIILTSNNEKNLTIENPMNLPIFVANIKTKNTIEKIIRGKNIIAFSGIGYPKKFLNLLKSLGGNIINFKSFPDHFNYKPRDILNFINLSKKENLICVTTEKDYIKVPNTYKKNIIPITIEMAFDKPNQLKKFLIDRLHI